MEKEIIEEKKLKVGDVIYGENRMYGINEVLIVEKTTRTQAVCGDIRFKIEIGPRGNLKKVGDDYGMWNRTSYYLETPELKEKYYRQKAIEKLKGFNYSKLNTGTLKNVLLLIEP